MSAEVRLRVVLCWHMHQPQYCDLTSGEYRLPWTYLHAMKDYTDMAAHLEAVPEARAVVNFAPVLLEQIDDYVRQIDGFINNSVAIRDPILAALAAAALPADQEARLRLVKAALRINRKRIIARFPAYERLAEMADWLLAHPGSMTYLSDDFLADILVWYHLGWLGESERRQDTRVQRLISKGAGFTLHERRELLEVIGGLLGGVISRYRRLAESGRIEVSVTPYAHPIAPLLLDFGVAREAMPEARLPLLDHYPGGRERVRWHIDESIAVFQKHFGFRPGGCWPAEGGISAATLEMLAAAGFRWTASGENVLRNSLMGPANAVNGTTPTALPCLHRVYQLQDIPVACFFRDDGLSDLIGFTYSDWRADDAVANLVGHLESIDNACRGVPGAVVSIIMDGENAWEHYPENGHYFLSALYQRLTTHARLELTTFSACLERSQAPGILPGLTAGSWVYGNFSTWIGHADKNRGWDMLGDAKRAFDIAVERKRLSGARLEAATRQLAVCEGSDWFWWFGDDNPAETVCDFDCLYRMHLANLYQMIGEEPPQYLSHAFTRGGGEPQHGGVMRTGKQA
ncbi:MAG: glycoside hydrolase [Acidiferrobacterales bacterium]